MIIVIGGIKGGSGKTTIATNLTVLRASTGKKVLLVDADEQKSSSSWSQQREMEGLDTPWVTIQLSGSSIRSQIQKLIHDYDDIIIDVGGRDTSSQRSSLICADVFIVPFQPRSFDIWTIGDVRNLINDASSLNEKLKSFALINRGDSSGADNKDALEVLKECNNLICIPFVICQRKSFSNAAALGLGVNEMKIIDKKAVEEINRLYQFIYNDDRKDLSQ